MTAPLTAGKAPRTDTLAKRFVTGGAWNLLGNGVSQALILGAQIAVSRTLGKTHFGQIGILYGTLITFGTFAGLGLGLTAIKHVAEFHLNDKVRAGRIIFLTSLITWLVAGTVTLAVALAARWIAETILKDAALATSVRVGSPLILLTAVGTLQQGVLLGFESFRAVASLNVARGICSIPFLLVGAWWNGVSGVLVAYVMLATLQCIVNYRLIAEREQTFRIERSYSHLTDEIPLLWKFSVPAFLCSIFWPLSVWLTNLFVVRLPNGYQQMGELNAIRQLQAGVNVIPVALNGAVMPILTSVLTNTPDDQDRSLRFTNNLSFVAILPIAIVLMLGAPWIMKLYGRGYGDGWPILVLMIGATAVNLLNSAAGTFILAKGAMVATLISSLLTSLVLVLALYFSIARWELYSVSFATLGVSLMSTVGETIYAVRYLHFPARTGRVIILSGIALAGVTAGLPWCMKLFLR